MIVIYRRRDWLALQGEMTFSSPSFVNDKFYFTFYISSCPGCCLMCHCSLRPPFRVIVVVCWLRDQSAGRHVGFCFFFLFFSPSSSRRALLQLVSGDLSLPYPTQQVDFIILLPKQRRWLHIASEDRRSEWIMLRVYVDAVRSLPSHRRGDGREKKQQTKEERTIIIIIIITIIPIPLPLCRCVMYQNVPVAPSYLE